MCVTTRNSLETIFQYHFWSSILMCQIHMLCINSDRYTSGGHVSIDLQSKAKHIPGVTSVYFTSHRKLMPSLIMAFVTYILLAALHTRLRNSKCLKIQGQVTLSYLCSTRNGSELRRGASRQRREDACRFCGLWSSVYFCIFRCSLVCIVLTWFTEFVNCSAMSNPHWNGD